MPGPEEPPKRLRASALRYEAGEQRAPKVVATGAGEIARRILEIAGQHGIPVKSDPALAEALGRLELAQEIPEDLFNAVAEVLVWAYGLDRSGAA
jgi:flagellar biosynthesis protein